LEKDDVHSVDDRWRIPDALWERIEPLLPPECPKPKGGRPRAPSRRCMDAIFYVLRTGCQWKALPRCLGAASTVHDRFQEWREAGVFCGEMAYRATMRSWDWNGSGKLWTGP